jgi:hypothetical protein
MLLHVAVSAGSIAIVLAGTFTPQGRSVVKAVWGWLKDTVCKKVSSSPWHLWAGYRRRTRSEIVEWGVSCQRDAAPQQEVSPSGKLLKELPSSVGCEQLTVPALPPSPEAELPRHLFAPMLKNSVSSSPKRKRPRRR